MRRVSYALLGALLAACGSDAVDVGNVSPVGSVGGVLVDAASRAPLEGVEVTLLAGGRVFDPRLTDARGTFEFTGVPAGEVIVTIAASETHQGATLRGTLADAAGRFPRGNATLTLGPLGLIANGATFTFRVLDASGGPVSGYTVGVETQLAYIDYGGGFADAKGQVLHQVQTDADGYATVTDVPDYFALGSVTDAVVVLLPPRDRDGDGVPEFPGGDVMFNLRSLSATPDIILSGPVATSLTVRASTIARLAGITSGTPTVVATDADLYVTFNLPVQSPVEVHISDEQGAGVVVPASAITVRDDTLRIALAGLGIDPGSEYNLQMHAVGAVGDRFVLGDFAAPFFTASPDTSVSIVSVSRDPVSQEVTVRFSEPVGLGHYGADSVLSGGNCVVFLEYDINNSLIVGDASAELGYQDCSLLTFRSDEWDPPGLPVRSGYSSRWTFTSPLQASTNAMVPVDRPVHLVFARVTKAAAVVRRADGRPIGDLSFLMP